jgi:hypothetical protein
MSFLPDIVFLSALVGFFVSLACLVLVLVLLAHERRWVLLTYPSVRRLRWRVVVLFSVLGGTLLGGGGDCCCYNVIVPCLDGYSQDPDRTIMYWFYRYVFGPLGWCVGQAGWDKGMEAIRYLPIVLTPFFFWAGCRLVRGRLTRAYRLDPRDWLPLCPYCLYNLTGNTSGVCPECGEKTG